MMKTIDYENLFVSLPESFSGKQRRVNIQSAVKVFYGISPEGFLRLAFLLTNKAPKLEATKLIRVVDGEETPGVFWLSFDLLSIEAKSAFFAFCQNMTDVVCGTKSELEAVIRIKKRYESWKTLFKSVPQVSFSREMVQGLFGELFFLKNYMIEKYGVINAVNSWSGPDATSKDFAINTEWYEVKTIGASSVSVKINSLAQLSSIYPGKLVVIRVEGMSKEFSNGESCISELVTEITSLISDDSIEEVFLRKVSSYGVGINDEAFAVKFDVKSLARYRVAPGFPRITFDEIPYDEINNVSYEIAVAGISRFLEE